jgi:hypothetical protein
MLTLPILGLPPAPTFVLCLNIFIVPPVHGTTNDLFLIGRRRSQQSPYLRTKVFPTALYNDYVPDHLSISARATEYNKLKKVLLETKHKIKQLVREDVEKLKA